MIPLDQETFRKTRQKYSGSESAWRLEEEPEGFFVSRIRDEGPDWFERDSCAFSKRSFDDWWDEAKNRLRGILPENTSAFRLPTPSELSRAPNNRCQGTWLPSLLGTVLDSRVYNTAVWTGSEMIIWGGYGGPGSYFDNGSRYDPSTDTWVHTSTGAGCPSPRKQHTGVWTGSEMIIWGGENGVVSLSTGGRYNPTIDAWTATSTGGNCPAARYAHTAVWTSSEMIIWGGQGTGALSTGARYDPTTDSWTATSTGANCPVARYNHSALWCNGVMVVWGGSNGAALGTGGRYAPASDTWESTSAGGNCPTARYFHTAVWSGSEVIVWGGYTGFGPLKTGGRYNPITDTWNSVAVPAPAECSRLLWKSLFPNNGYMDGHQ